MLKYASTDSERANTYHNIGVRNYLRNNYAEGLPYLEKSINTYKSILNKRKLDTDEAWNCGLSYLYKGYSLEELYRYEEAIDAHMKGKRFVEKFKKEHFYQNLINSFNEGLSSCYKKLVK